MSKRARMEEAEELLIYGAAAGSAIIAGTEPAAAARDTNGTPSLGAGSSSSPGGAKFAGCDPCLRSKFRCSFRQPERREKVALSWLDWTKRTNGSASATTEEYPLANVCAACRDRQGASRDERDRGCSWNDYLQSTKHARRNRTSDGGASQSTSQSTPSTGMHWSPTTASIRSHHVAGAGMAVPSSNGSQTSSDADGSSVPFAESTITSPQAPRPLDPLDLSILGHPRRFTNTVSACEVLRANDTADFRKCGTTAAFANAMLVDADCRNYAKMLVGSDGQLPDWIRDDLGMLIRDAGARPYVSEGLFVLLLALNRDVLSDALHLRVSDDITAYYVSKILELLGPFSALVEEDNRSPFVKTGGLAFPSIEVMMAMVTENWVKAKTGTDLTYKIQAPAPTEQLEYRIFLRWHTPVAERYPACVLNTFQGCFKELFQTLWRYMQTHPTHPPTGTMTFVSDGALGLDPTWPGCLKYEFLFRATAIDDDWIPTRDAQSATFEG